MAMSWIVFTYFAEQAMILVLATQCSLTHATQFIIIISYFSQTFDNPDILTPLPIAKDVAHEREGKIVKIGSDMPVDDKACNIFKKP